MTQMISQTFDVKGGPHYGRENVPKLRAALDELGLDGFLIPHEDEYDNEYLPDCNERLLWVTGFSGSAGAALVMKDRAAVFVDGRYTLQVKDQVDGSIFDYCDLVGQGLYGWIEDHGRKGEKIGYDARLHSPAALNLLRTAAQRAGVTLVSVDTNPVDTAWTDRPAAPKTPVVPHPIEFAGEDHASKRSRIGIAIRKGGADAAVITAPPSIAWLFNVRGSDVSRSPLPLSAAIIEALLPVNHVCERVPTIPLMTPGVGDLIGAAAACARVRRTLVSVPSGRAESSAGHAAVDKVVT